MDGDGSISHAARQEASPVALPPEWAFHQAMWLGFPARRALWREHFEQAQLEVARLASCLAREGGERVRLVAWGRAVEAAERLLGDDAGVELVRLQAGDLWLRDTGPLFLERRRAAVFGFNGWGGKFRLRGDRTVARRLAAAAGVEVMVHRFVLEGGAIDVDGEGTALTTRQCLLNPNRNVDWSEARAQAALRESLGLRKVVWLNDGLRNDHTDGHVDNLARFVAPGCVAVAAPSGPDDPNADIYARAAAAVETSTDATGRTLQVARVPSPGRVMSDDGTPRPASHMNFVIANRAVVVPVYDEVRGKRAVEALRPLFPGRAVVGLPSRALLTGGGSFHCITQPEPAP